MYRMPPTSAEIAALHHKYAASEHERELVYTHCVVVADIAEQLAHTKPLNVDLELIKSAALLHDIGVYKVLDGDGKLQEGKHYITHGVEGAAILHDEGFPESFCRFASCHTGTGLSKDDITSQNLPLPAQDYIAQTLEERLIMYADKFHSKTTPPVFNSFEYYRRHVAQFGEHKAKQFDTLAQEFGIPDLAPLAVKYEYTIR